MSESLAGVLFVTSLAVALVVVHRPLGDLPSTLTDPAARVRCTAGFGRVRQARPGVNAFSTVRGGG